MRALVVACVLGCGLPVSALTVKPLSFPELVSESGAVVHGRVAEVRGQWTADRRGIESLVAVDAIDYLKGEWGERSHRSRAGRTGGHVHQPDSRSPASGSRAIASCCSSRPAARPCRSSPARRRASTASSTDASGALMVVPPLVETGAPVTARGDLCAAPALVAGVRRGRSPRRGGSMSRAVAVLLTAVLTLAQSVAGRRLSEVRVPHRRADGRREVGRPRRFATSSTNATFPGVTAADMRAAVARAAATWQAVPGTTLRFEDQGFTAARRSGSTAATRWASSTGPTSIACSGATSLLIDSSDRRAASKRTSSSTPASRGRWLPGRGRTRGRGVGRPARARALRRPRPLGHRRDRADRHRRAARPGLRRGDVPDRA